MKGLNVKWKIRPGAIVDNVVTNLYAKFDDYRSWNEKSLSIDNNNKKKNNVRSTWRPVSGSNNCDQQTDTI